MGTNFYMLGEMPEEIRRLTEQLQQFQEQRRRHQNTASDYWSDEEYGLHIGKRSAAGAYCWGCGLTLCKDGAGMIHSGWTAWYKACPRCGLKPGESKLGEQGNAAGVELGFAKPREQRPRSGVSSCSSFTWAVAPDAFMGWAAKNPDAKIRDEYGRELLVADFVRMLVSNCPIENCGAIGVLFS